MIELIKLALRIKTMAFDTEIAGLIESCKTDLKIAGLDKWDTADALTQQAVILYAKAHFGYRDDAERYENAYDMLKKSMAVSGEYHEFQ